MARYGQEFRNRALARLLPPESASLEEVSRAVGVSIGTLERWRSEALAEGHRVTTLSGRARLELVLTSAGLSEEQIGALCREHGVYPEDLAQWRAAAAVALDDPDPTALSPAQAKADRARVRELERQLRRKDAALAETAALLVLSKKASAIFHGSEAE